MENATLKPGLMSYVLRYGLMISAAQIVLVLLFYVLGISPLAPGISFLNLFLVLAINIVFVRMAMVKYRQVNFDGQISYGQIFVLGVLILLLAGIINGAFTYFFYNVFEPELMQNYANEMLDKLAARLPEDQLEMMEERINRNLEPARQLRQTLINIPASALVLSAIVSLFIKKDTTLPE